MRNRPARLVFAGLVLLCGTLQSGAASAQSETDYTVNSDWAQVPGGQGWDGATSWVAPDGRGQVLVFVRTPPYFRLFTRDGEFIRSWGEEGMFQNAHSVSFDGQGNVWATDAANHVVYKFGPDGEILLTLGRKGEAGDNQSEELFNQPNHVAVAPNGDIYVSDGYVNARIVQFNADGEFQRVIGGEAGSEPGQLQVPHGVALDSQGRILVNDSDNKRVTVFNPDGSFAETWPFPSRGGIVVTADDSAYISDVNAGVVQIVRDGELVDSIAIEGRPHGLGVDSDGTVYVSDSLGRSVMKITRQP